ncbi:MAG: hypothetical protein U0359_19635 [Byssovorax sp.]
MAEIPLHPIADSYWALPGKLLAGEYPGARDEREARDKVRRLLQAGVTFFLDLTEATEPLRPYAHLAREEAEAMGIAVDHRRLPIRDLSVPTAAHLETILATIDERIGAGAVVYVHCWGGIGRTGTVVGCTFVRRGMSGEEALAHIEALRKDTPDGWKRSPETDDQRDTVLRFR